MEAMRLVAGLLAAFGFTVAAQDRPPERGLDFYSREKEIALGDRLAEDARQRTTPFDNPAFRNYVDGLAGRLMTFFPEPRCSYTFSPIADDVGGPAHEPLSFPGGPILLPARLILETRTEAEFAGMLAHAMAHCAERHGTRSTTRADLPAQTAIPVIFVGGWSGMGAQDAVIPVGMRGLQHEFEIEADALGAKVMAAAGFDPQALADYLRRSGVDEIRLTGLSQAIRQLAATTSSPSDADFFSLRDDVRAAFPARQPAPPHLLK